MARRAGKTGSDDPEKALWYNAVVMTGNESTLFNKMMSDIFGETANHRLRYNVRYLGERNSLQ